MKLRPRLVEIRVRMIKAWFGWIFLLMITIFSISPYGWWPLWLQIKKSPGKNTGALWWFRNFQTYGAEVTEFWLPNICHCKFYKKLRVSVKVERRVIRGRDSFAAIPQSQAPKIDRCSVSSQKNFQKNMNNITCQQWDSNPRPFGPVPETGALDQLGHIDLLNTTGKV